MGQLYQHWGGKAEANQTLALNSVCIHDKIKLFMWINVSLSSCPSAWDGSPLVVCPRTTTVDIAHNNFCSVAAAQCKTSAVNQCRMRLEDRDSDDVVIVPQTASCIVVVT